MTMNSRDNSIARLQGTGGYRTEIKEGHKLQEDILFRIHRILFVFNSFRSVLVLGLSTQRCYRHS